MTGWLLDANVVSEPLRRRPNSTVLAFFRSQPVDSLHVSVATLAELRYGMETVIDAQRRASLREWIANDIRPLFADRVIPITEDVMLRWRVLVEQGRKDGHTFPEPDLLIAASAITHGLTVVTRNVRDFVLAGAPVLNPWAPEPS